MTGSRGPYGAALELVEALTGCDIADHLVGRVAPHAERQVARHGLQGPEGYLALLRSAAGGAGGDGGDLGSALLDELLALLMVHETFFYRFASQLDALEGTVLPELMAGRTTPLRIWSAGCSRGPEPYTLAMIATIAARRLGRREPAAEVLGTDICEAFLDEASRGVYDSSKLGDLPREHREAFLELEPDPSSGSEERYVVGSSIRRIVRFRRHGLLDPPPATGFDVISCRNVLIYLRPEARERALEGLAEALAPEGVLLVGHSESLRDVAGLFQPRRRLALGIYRSTKGAPRSEPPPPLGGLAARRPGVLGAIAAREVVASPPPPPPPEPRPAPDRAEVVRLTGEYDRERSPAVLEGLKELLGRAIESGRDVVIEADGAEVLDEAAGRLVARAARAVNARGRRLVVMTTRRPVRRWAERHHLPLGHGGDRDEVRRT